MFKIYHLAFIQILLLGVVNTMAVAAPQSFVKNGVTKSTALTQSYTWYDGNSAQQIWLNPGLMAEFNPSTKGAKAVKSVNPAASQLDAKNTRGAVRVWQLNADAVVATRSLSTAHPKGAYSPIFRDEANSGGRMRALPGNIIVTLNPAWDAATVNKWLQKNKLEVVNKLNIGTNTYLIKTAPGLASLDAANALYQAGEVVSASPNWWKEVSTR